MPTTTLASTSRPPRAREVPRRVIPLRGPAPRQVRFPAPCPLPPARSSTRSPPRPAWSPAAWASSAPIWSTRWPPPGHTSRVVDALVPEHGGDRRNLDGLEHPEGRGPARGSGDRGRRRGRRGCRRRVQRRRTGEPPRRRMRDPLRDLHLNAREPRRVPRDAPARQPRARVVHTSTRQVYGRPERPPVDETHPTRPVDVNGVAKLAGEQLHLRLLPRPRAWPTTACGSPTSTARGSGSTSDLGFLPVFFRKALLGERDRDLRRRHAAPRLRVRRRRRRRPPLAATADRGDRRGVQRRQPPETRWREIAEAVIDAAGSATAGCALVPWPEDQQRIDIGSFHTDSAAIHRGARLAAATDDRRRRRATGRLLPGASVVPVVDLSRRAGEGFASLPRWPPNASPAAARSCSGPSSSRSNSSSRRGSADARGRRGVGRVGAAVGADRRRCRSHDIVATACPVECGTTYLWSVSMPEHISRMAGFLSPGSGGCGVPASGGQAEVLFQGETTPVW